MLCSSCSSSNPESNRFCGQCGAKLPEGGLSAEAVIVPAGPVSSAFRKEVEKQDYQLRQLHRRSTDVSGTRSDETLVGNVSQSDTRGDSSDSIVVESRAADEGAAERGNEEPPISGPSFLGLGEPERDPKSNLSYLYEDEPRSGRARYWVAALIILGCIGFFAYEWKQNWNWDTTIIGRHKAQQADAGKPGADAAPESGEKGVADGKAQAPLARSLGAQPSAPASGDSTSAAKSQAPGAEQDAAAGSESTGAEHTAGSSQTGTANASQEPPVASSGTNEAAKGSSNSTAAAQADKNSANADERTSPDQTEEGSAEVADAVPPPTSRNSKRVPAKSARSRYADKESGSELVTKAEAYLYGRGVPKNCDQALVYLRTAANRGNADARSKLGALYATGHCVSMDRAEAYNWFTLAREAGSKNVWVERNREMLWSQMTPAERERTLGP